MSQLARDVSERPLQFRLDPGEQRLASQTQSLHELIETVLTEPVFEGSEALQNPIESSRLDALCDLHQFLDRWHFHDTPSHFISAAVPPKAVVLTKSRHADRE